MLATELQALVSTDAVRQEMEEVLELARRAGIDSGLHGVPGDFEKQLEPLLRLLRERVFRDSQPACEARERRLRELDEERARLEEPVGEYRSRCLAGGSPLMRRWPAVASIAAAGLLVGLALEEFGVAAMSPRLALIVGLSAGLLILNFENLISLPARLRARWHAWRVYRNALARLNTCRGEIESLRREDLERTWVHEWAEHWIHELRHAALVEHDYHKNRAALARGV
jgi:hypothetical protein